MKVDKTGIFGWLWSILLHTGIFLLLLYLSSYDLSPIHNNRSNIVNIDIVSITKAVKTVKLKKVYRKKNVIKHKIKIKKSIKIHPKKIRKIKKSVIKKNSKKKIKKKIIKPVESRKLRLIRKRLNKTIEQIQRHNRRSAITAIQKKLKIKIGHTSKEKISYDKLIRYLIQRRWTINNYILTKKNYYTIIKVVLAKSGSLLKISSIKSSGNGYFDKTCIDAVKLAAPFPPYEFSLDRTNDIILTCRVDKNEIH